MVFAGKEHGNTLQLAHMNYFVAHIDRANKKTVGVTYTKKAGITILSIRESHQYFKILHFH